MSNPVRANQADAAKIGNAIRSGGSIVLGEGLTYIPEELSEEAKKVAANIGHAEDEKLIRAALLVEEKRPFNSIENNEHLLARFDELYHYEKAAKTERAQKMLHKMVYAVCERIRSIKIRIEWTEKRGNTEIKKFKNVPLLFTKDPLNPNWRDAWLNEYIEQPAETA